MVLWYLAPSIVAVHDIFRSRGLDYRLIALGALLPLLIDAAVRLLRVRALARSWRSRCSAVVMLATIGRPRLAAPAAHLPPDRLDVRAGALRRVPARRVVPLAAARLGLPGRLAGPAGDGARAARRGRARDRRSGRGAGSASPTARRATTSCARGRLRERGRVILFVRHGETEANRRRLALGRADPPLTERGEEQAAALAHRLASARRRGGRTRARCCAPARPRRRSRPRSALRGGRRRPARRARLRRVGQHELRRPAAGGAARAGATTRRSRRRAARACARSPRASRASAPSCSTGRDRRRGEPRVADQGRGHVGARRGRGARLADVPRPRVDHPHRRPRRPRQPRRLQRHRHTCADVGASGRTLDAATVRRR